MNMEWIRQGDIAFVRTDKMPALGYANRKPQTAKWLVVAQGEVTGHAHKLEGTFEFLADRENEPSFIKVQGTAVLTHQEHATVEIPEGTWRVVRQREFWGEERRVAD